MTVLKIGNRGPEIEHTNYWESEHADGGLCYLSANAGTWRLLVPRSSEYMLAEMQTGTSVHIEPSIQAAQCWDVVFNDGSDAPFALAVDLRQIDRALDPGLCRLTVWTEAGQQLDFACEVLS